MTVSLCESCAHLREVISGKGSRFLPCLLSRSDARFPKYPPQPVVFCAGYELRRDGTALSQDAVAGADDPTRQRMQDEPGR